MKWHENSIIFVAFLSSTNTNEACQSEKRKILVPNPTKVVAECKQHIVEEKPLLEGLLKGERDRLLQEVEEMKIELCASKRRTRKLLVEQAKDQRMISSLQSM